MFYLKGFLVSDPAPIWKIVFDRENKIKGDQWNKRFRTVQVYFKNGLRPVPLLFLFLDSF